MKKSRKLILALIVLALIVFIIFRMIHSNSSHRAHRSMTLSVVTAEATLKPAPLFITTQGTVDASQSVDIQPQISGIIQKIGFTPGQNVTAGQLLFQLDPTTYQATLTKAQANLAKDQAQLPTVQNDELRYQDLLKKGYVSTQDYEQVKAQLDSQLNIIKSDEADIKEAQAKLGYTHITAPFTGRSGNVTVKQGDLVQLTGAQPLVTINQLQPVFVNFYITQHDLLAVMDYQKQHPLSTMAYSEDKKQLLDTGTLTFIDNEVDPDSGTILLKSTMPNKDAFLWPGETVNVKLILTVNENQVAIPSQALQSGQQGQFVYLIQNNRAVIRPVKVLRQIGSWAFIKEGLKPGDRVATVFSPDLQDQSPVKIISATMAGQIS